MNKDERGGGRIGRRYKKEGEGKGKERRSKGNWRGGKKAYWSE